MFQAEYLRIPGTPRERVTTEHLLVESRHSPRASHETFILESSPTRHRDVQYEEVIERPARRHTISRPRSVSVHTHGRVVSPVRYIQPREYSEEHIEARPRDSGSMVLVRPRHSDHDVSDYIRELEEETRLLRLERQGGIEITRQRDAEYIDSKGNEEEVTEIRREERRGMALKQFSSINVVILAC